MRRSVSDNQYKKGSLIMCVCDCAYTMQMGVLLWTHGCGVDSPIANCGFLPLQIVA
jgi:hypothetical protein